MLTRFAPSPTGLLHVGNVRTALVNYLYTRAKGGTFMLRMDDTDRERSKDEYKQQIKQDLEWLGLTWDDYAQQSDRFDRYNEVIEQLKQNGRLYPCYESQEELGVKRKMQLNQGRPPIYDRAALKLTDDDRENLEAEGKQPHWRFKLEDKPITWEDEVRGAVHFEGKNLSDPILIRECGTPTYMLPSAVDDADLNITHIVRGEDHISNTAIQIQLFEALGANIPTFAHVSLIKHKDDKISKRVGGFDIASLKEDNITPLAICSYLATLGTSDPIELKENMDTLIQNFDINKYSKAQANYDYDELKRLNTKQLHHLSYHDVKDTIPDYINEVFFEAVKANLENINEIDSWWKLCNEALTPIIANEDQDFIAESVNQLPEGEWDETTWSTWTTTLKETTDRKGKTLFMPLRKALTAMEHGPELKKLLPLIGRDRTIERLKGNSA